MSKRETKIINGVKHYKACQITKSIKNPEWVPEDEYKARIKMYQQYAGSDFEESLKGNLGTLKPGLKKGKWKITKFWSEIADKNDDYSSMIEGWKYEVAYWTKDNVEDEEYFDDRKEAELYLEECINEEMNK